MDDSLERRIAQEDEGIAAPRRPRGRHRRSWAGAAGVMSASGYLAQRRPPARPSWRRARLHARESEEYAEGRTVDVGRGPRTSAVQRTPLPRNSDGRP